MNIKGIDVSHWQGKIDWSKVAKDGIKFAVIKCTQGSEDGSAIFDKRFIENVKGANANGITTHAYHYLVCISESDAVAEADWFIKNVKKADVKGYLFVDVEDKVLGSNKEVITKYINAFLNRLREKGFKKVGVYCNRNWYQNYIIPRKVHGPVLWWVAAYNNRGAGVVCDIWQHTSSGRVNGINGNVDMNIAYTDKVIEKVPESSKPKEKKTSPKSSEAIVPYPGKLFKLTRPYMRGKDVERIQRALNHAVGMDLLVVDGIYGPKTAAAVRDYQRRHGLKIDGIVGPQTWNTLF